MKFRNKKKFRYCILAHFEHCCLVETHIDTEIFPKLNASVCCEKTCIHVLMFDCVMMVVQCAHEQCSIQLVMQVVKHFIPYDLIPSVSLLELKFLQWLIVSQWCRKVWNTVNSWLSMQIIWFVDFVCIIFNMNADLCELGFCPLSMPYCHLGLGGVTEVLVK
jgi:hypothetical protein